MGEIWESVIWTAFVNTAIGPNPNDLSKVSGVPNVFDADAISTQQIPSAITGAGISFLFRPAFTGGVAAGLSATNPDRKWQSINYCWMWWEGGLPALVIYENGVSKWSTGVMPGASAIYSIIINSGGNIEYSVDGVLKYTSSTAPAFPLFLECAMDVYGLRLQKAGINIGLLYDVGINAGLRHAYRQGFDLVTGTCGLGPTDLNGQALTFISARPSGSFIIRTVNMLTGAYTEEIFELPVVI